MEIISKTFKENSEIRIILINGKEWFVAKDVAQILDYKDTDQAIRQHCKKAKSFETVNFTNSNFSSKARTIKIISEADVWRLLEKARTKTADEKLEINRFLGLNKNTKVILTKPEIEFVSELEKALKVFDVQSIRQFQVLNFKIDLYLPELKIAIEFDENDHKNYYVEAERQRQDFIEQTLNCQFLRLSDQDSVGTNIGKVLLFISRI
jgi:very-short-patch-repair endonuclease